MKKGKNKERARLLRVQYDLTNPKYQDPKEKGVCLE